MPGVDCKKQTGGGKKKIAANEPFDEREHKVVRCLCKNIKIILSFDQEFSKWVRFHEPIFDAIEKKMRKTVDKADDPQL